MPKKAQEPVRPRGRTDTTTVEVGKEIQREYKVAAVQMDVTLRELIEDALIAYRPQVVKRLSKAS
jgi:hypothetical protein